MIKIKFEVDEANPVHLKAVSDCLLALGGTKQVKAAEAAKPKPVKEEPKQVSTVKEISEEEAKQETVAEETKKEPKKEESPEGIQIDDVRALVTKLAGVHREAIKTKLTFFKAANVTALDPEHYEAFVEFLNTLE